MKYIDLKFITMNQEMVDIYFIKFYKFLKINMVILQLMKMPKKNLEKSFLMENILKKKI